MSRAGNIENSPIDKNPVSKMIEDDYFTAGECLLNMGNLGSAMICFEKAGLSEKELEKIERDWLNGHKDAIH